MPVWSRRSIKIKPPWSRRELTQPETVTVLPKLFFSSFARNLISVIIPLVEQIV